MAQWNKHPGCRHGVDRLAARRASIAVAGMFTLPRTSKDRGVIGAPEGPPG
jgi:hypothetical protein